MGGAVSSGRDNNELVDNLMDGRYIRTPMVERVFRVLDRADYMTPESRDRAYKDLAWRNGPLHMSAPCIYSKVVEGLDLRPGLSFLNIGSGTGYLQTLVGLIIGSTGISHGVEVSQYVYDYCVTKLRQFIENSPTLDEFDYCEPKYYIGNGLNLAPLQCGYDRVYVGASCPYEYENYFKQMLKIGGVLIMPLNDNLVQIRRLGEDEWTSKVLLEVSFAELKPPSNDKTEEIIKLDEQAPPKLQTLCRARVRGALRAALLSRQPALRPRAPRAPPPPRARARRICIPIDDDSDVEDLHGLHELSPEDGAHEMNALLSLVLSMGENRAAGALRYDAHSSDDDDDDDEPARPARPAQAPLCRLASRTLARLPPAPPLFYTFRIHEASPPRARRLTRSAARAARSASSASPPARRTRSRAAATEEEMECEPPQLRRSKRRQKLDSGIGEPSSSGTASTSSAKMSRTTRSTSRTSTRATRSSSRAASSSSRAASSLSRTSRARSTRMAGSSSSSLEAGGSSASPGTSSSTSSGTSAGTSPGTSSGAACSSSSSRADKSDDSGTESATCSPTQDSGRRRLPKRARARSGSAGRKRRAGAGAESNDARRVRLSQEMKMGIRDLPLPPAMKKYVNLGRCYQF